jgi:dienelactone hydrolase
VASSSTAIAPRIAVLNEEGFEGELYLPEQNEPWDRCVIVLAGSGGGLAHRESAEALARAGHPALALAYFNYRELPRKMERIALEYFERAADYCGRQPEFGNLRIVLMGRSRGAELALQLAASCRRFHGVIATSPSHVLWPGMGGANPAWTYHGEPLPFVHNRAESAPKAKVDQVVDGKPYMIMRDHSFFHLTDNPTAERATIAVEDVNGPILLFSGKDDMLWPSAFFADRIEERARTRGFRFSVENVQYEGVGHDFPLPGQPATLRAIFPGAAAGVAYGGSADLIERAASDRWQRILEFLTRTAA